MQAFNSGDMARAASGCYAEDCSGEQTPPGTLNPPLNPTKSFPVALLCPGEESFLPVLSLLCLFWPLAALRPPQHLKERQAFLFQTSAFLQSS